jgi:hypothetical protein
MKNTENTMQEFIDAVKKYQNVKEFNPMNPDFIKELTNWDEDNKNYLGTYGNNLIFAGNVIGTKADLENVKHTAQVVVEKNKKKLLELEQELINISKRMSKIEMREKMGSVLNFDKEKRQVSQEVKSIMSKFEKYNDVFSIIKNYSNNHIINKPNNKNKVKIVH